MSVHGPGAQYEPMMRDNDVWSPLLARIQGASRETIERECKVALSVLVKRRPEREVRSDWGNFKALYAPFLPPRFWSDFLEERDALAKPKPPLRPVGERTPQSRQPGPSDRPLTIAEMVPTAMARADRRRSGAEQPVPLPFPSYAQIMAGGLWPGVHMKVAGTGVGKTTVALQESEHALDQGIPT